MSPFASGAGTVTAPLGAAAGRPAGLAAALCWTLASLLWRRVPTSLNAAQLNLLKNLLALAMQLPVVLFTPWTASGGAVAILALSGIVGIALGDSLFFASLRRLGTRRSLTLNAGGPGLTALVGFALLGEVLRPDQWLGIVLISAAMVLVAWPQVPDQALVGLPSDGLGLCLGIGALACGSAGALLSRAALLSGELSPLQAATLRLGAAALIMAPLLAGLPRPGQRPLPAQRRWPSLVLATFLGTSLGVALQQAALAGLPGGLAVALLSTSPVMALPLSPLEGDQPGWIGWAAAVSALVGVSLVVGWPLRAGS